MNFLYYFPGCTTDDDFWKIDMTSPFYPLFMEKIYTPMYTRAMPYAFGMYVGYLHVNYPTYDFTKGTAWKEWICLLCYTYWSIIGIMPFTPIEFVKNAPASV